MKQKSLTLVTIVALLALFASAMWLFLAADSPPASSDTRMASKVPPEVQTQIATGDDWSAPFGLATFGNQVKLLAFSPVSSFK